MTVKPKRCKPDGKGYLKRLYKLLIQRPWMNTAIEGNGNDEGRKDEQEQAHKSADLLIVVVVVGE